MSVPKKVFTVSQIRKPGRQWRGNSSRRACPPARLPGQDRAVLTAGQRAVQDVLCAEPAQGNVAAVNSRQHGGVVEAQTALCVDELLIQTLAGFGVLLVLEALADEALDHADSGDVLLYGGVQVVVILENGGMSADSCGK